MRELRLTRQTKAALSSYKQPNPAIEPSARVVSRLMSFFASD